MQDPAEKTSPSARNVLSMSDLIRLADWARAHREQCETISNKTLATMAGETLSLYLTAANIASALEAVGIAKAKPKAPPTLEERVTKLETDVEAYAARLARIESKLNLHEAFETAKSHLNGPGLTGEEDAATYLNFQQPPPTTPPLHGLPDLDTAAAEVIAQRANQEPCASLSTDS